MIESLYIHIPFCDSICSYCSFKKQIYNEEQSKKYILNLLDDLKRIPKCSLKTIYIGGGTPSSLADNDLEILLSNLKPLLKEDYEFTIESNPENLTFNKAKIFNKYGVNRVSIGVQTFNEKFLKLLSRKHSLNDINEAINNLLLNNINNINFDLIYGLPFQTLNDFILDIKYLKNFPLTHVSLYSLTIDENTIFNNLKYEEADEDLLRDMSDEATKILSEYGFSKYEVSNYSKPNYESKHNLTYWFDNEYYGIGISASGYENNIRYKNITSLKKYNEGERKFEEETVDDFNHEYEFIMLNLRTKYGIDLDRYKEIFNKDFLKTYKNEIEKLSDFIIINNNKVTVKDNNYMILNTIILEFIKKLEDDFYGKSNIKK